MKKLALILVCFCPSAWGAIAFDAASKAQTTAIFKNSFPATVSWTHTVTGPNPFLSVEVTLQGTAGNAVSGITYNSVAMTKSCSAGDGAVPFTEIWTLKAPATGANTITATITGSGTEGGMIQAVSLSGVDQNTPVDVSTGGVLASATTVSLSTNTVKDQDWMVDSVYIFVNNTVTSTNGTARVGFNDTGDIAVSTVSTRGPLTPAGSFSMGYTFGAASSSDYCIVAIMPVQAVAAAGGASKIMKLRRYDEEW